MYTNTDAISRAEITEFLEQARGADSKFIADRIFPPHGVKRRAGTYPVIKIKDGGLLRLESTKRGASGTYNEVQRATTRDNYTCEDRGLKERVDDVSAEDMEDFFDMEVLTGKLVLRSMMLDHENEVAKKAFDKDTFLTLDPVEAYTEANLDKFDFVRDVINQQEWMSTNGQTWNTLVLSLQLFNLIRLSRKVQTAIFGLTNQDIYKLVSEELLAKALRVDNILIASASYDAGAKGKPSDLKPIWKPDYFGLYNVQGGSFVAGGVGRSLTWEADVPDGIFATETYRDEDRRGDMVRVRCNIDEKVIDETAGVLVKTGYVPPTKKI